RTGQYFEQSARFVHGEQGIDPHRAAGIHERKATGRTGRAQVREQRYLCSRGWCRWGGSDDRVAWADAKGRKRRRAGGGCATHSGWSVAPAKSKLRTNFSREAAGGGYYASFNFHFLRLAVKLGEQPVDVRHHRGDIRDDDRIGALVGNHVTALRQEFFQCKDNVFGVGITQEPRDRLLIDSQCLGFLLSPARFGFMAQRFQGGDAQHVAVKLTSEIVVFEHDVEGLIPRHVIQHDGQRTFNVGVEHYIQSADLVNQAEEIF